MAKQDVNIGVEGNDGTGGSVRDSFRKVNENFTELYAIFGLGGNISFTTLNDTPNTLLGNEGRVPLVKQDGTGIGFFDLVSDAGTNDPNNSENTISFEVDGEKLVVKSINAKIGSDPAPAVQNPFKISAPTAYNNFTQDILVSNDRSSMVSDFNSVHVGSAITEDNLLVSKGYTDLSYIKAVGGTLTGPLEVPAGASGAEVPQVDEVVQRAGDTMLGPLTLYDHPSPFSGLGTPNGQEDLQAVTKLYVDSSSYSSTVNLYVTKAGSDTQSLSPPGKKGRSESYSYASISAACAKAARIQEASPIEAGPYVQVLQYQDGADIFNAYLLATNTASSPFGYSTAGNQSVVATTIENQRANVITNTISAINAQFPTFVYNEAICSRDVGLIIDSIKLDIQASTGTIKNNYLSRFAGLRYFANPSSEVAIDTNGQYTETAFGITQAKTLLLAEIASSLGTTSDEWYTAVAARFDDVLNTIDQTTDDPVLVEAPNYYKVFVHSGPDKYTIQSGNPASATPNADVIPGKVIVGRTSKAIGRIVTYTRGANSAGSPTYDTVEMELLSPVEFTASEELDFGSSVKETQITILVETGIYKEQLPIRIPNNTSLKGDEFRRVIVRPADGVSQSSAARSYFYRDAVFDGLTIATGGEAEVDLDSGNTVGYYGYHYLTDPSDPLSTPMNNNEMDVFLTNDATIIRNLTVQRQGGFMMVLDPAGSIQTKSPYAQTCSSFSKSKNTQTFAGGMFIDGYTYNIPVTIVSKDDNFTVNIEAAATSGLGIRKPKMPASYFISGVRYQVNAIKNYVADDGGVASATLIISENSNSGDGFDDAIDSAGGLTPIVLQGAGNKSMLANDYTQINDLGYGIVAMNNSLAELVSVFTYYCHTGYFSGNGSQLRSLTGNNSYGTYGMIAAGSDTDEKSAVVTLAQNHIQPAKMFVVDQELLFTGDLTALLTNGEIITQLLATSTLAFSNYDGINTTLYLQSVSGGIFNSTDEVFEGSSTSLGIPDDVVNRGFSGNKGSISLYVYDLTEYPLNASEIEILHASGLYQPYDVVSATETSVQIPTESIAALCDSGSTIQATVWRLDLSSGIASSDTGLQENTAFGTLAVYRLKQNILVNGIPPSTLTRPSTALVFNEYEFTYRTIAFENTIVGSVPTVGQQSRITIDSNFVYVDLLASNDRAVYTIGNDYTIDSTVGSAPSGGTTLGRTQGDLNFATGILDVISQGRILGMIFAWAGKLHRITGFSEATDTSGTSELTGQAFSIITFEDVYNINPAFLGIGLAARVDSIVGDNISIKAGLEQGDAASITVNISTCRATSHDFLDVGTGGYNTSNYPDRIYGAPAISAVSDEESVDSTGLNSKAQVQERSRGRVFFASTDQDGFFRVGRFFTVDQGTGRITFNAALVLTNIDGIGFKRGVRVNEFSADTTFTNATADSVPVETAVEGYINRRLGWDRNGVSITPGNVIGGGSIKKSGDAMTGPLSLGGNQITNVSTPTSGSDGVNKSYVDALLDLQNELSELTDVTISGVADGNLLVYNSTGSQWVNADLSTDPAVSDVAFTIVGGIISAQINAGAILDADVSASAAISQSKLNLNAATTRGNATGITAADRGSASFSSNTFSADNGWINIATDGVTNSMIVNSGFTLSNGTTSDTVELGSTVSINGTADQITVGYAAGAFTLSLPSTINTNAATATTATNAAVVGRNTTDAVHYPLFATAATGNLPLFTDTGLTYNPGTNTMKITGTGGLEFTFNSTSGSLLPRINAPTDSGQSIGSTANRWNTVFATTFNGTATEAMYADLAENYLGDADYRPGTVLVFGGDNEVTTTSGKGDRRVAGVVTTNPAHLMNSALEGEHVVGLALQGRVPCNVIGKVAKGDLLVSAAYPGYAIVDNYPSVGTIIGKAVSEKFDTGYGIVEVVVGRV
jgi:hypothetical protein